MKCSNKNHFSSVETCPIYFTPSYSIKDRSSINSKKNDSPKTNNNLSDAECIYLIQHQNEAAYIELAHRYTPLIYSLATSAHQSIREEIIIFLQEQLYLLALRYDPKRGIPATGYIAKSLRYAAWNFHKRVYRQWQHEALYDPQISVDSLLTNTSQDPADIVCQREVIQQVHHQLKTLTPKQQNILQMIYFDELSRHDIANTLNCTAQAVSDIHHRALRNLRQNKSIQ